MALLEQLRPDLMSLPREEALVLFSEYYHKRAEDLVQITVETKSPRKKAKSKAKGKTVTISPNDLEVLKKLGLM